MTAALVVKTSFRACNRIDRSKVAGLVDSDRSRFVLF